MKNHHLALAARYNDAKAESGGLEDVFADLDLEIDDVMYLAKQRAIRVVATLSDRPKLKEAVLGWKTEMTPVPPLTEMEKALYDAALYSSLDGIMIGYVGRELSMKGQVRHEIDTVLKLPERKPKS
jgi:hypothetical protein